MARVRITGWFEPEPSEADPNSMTGLSEKAYEELILDDRGTGLKLCELSDLTVEEVIEPGDPLMKTGTGVYLLGVFGFTAFLINTYGAVGWLGLALALVAAVMED